MRQVLTARHHLQRLLLLVGVLICTAAGRPGTAHTPAENDLHVRLGLLINFARFVEWPEAVAPAQLGHWNLCLLDAPDALVDAARELQDGSLYELPIQVHILKSARQREDCHLIYLSAALGRSKISDALRSGGMRHGLTVSDFPGFARRGGMVEIILDDGRYQFDVDYGNVLDAGLKLDSGMLRLARRVY